MAPSWPTFLRRCKAKERFDLKSTPLTLLALVAGGWHPFFFLVRFLRTFYVALVDVSNILTDYFSFSSFSSFFYSFFVFLLRMPHSIGSDIRVSTAEPWKQGGTCKWTKRGIANKPDYYSTQITLRMLKTTHCLKM